MALLEKRQAPGPGEASGPEALLRPGEGSVPRTVLQTIGFLAERGVWWQLSRNYEAFSCRDAARKRWRLGHEGIELWNELKSYFGRFRNASGREQYFMAHCRADRMLNLERLGEALKAQGEPERLGDEEVQRLGLRYGLVNPFETWKQSVYEMDGPLLTAPVLQVFDRELTRRLGVPGTVMTNAGDLTWAVEFDVVELVEKIDNAVVADIADPDPENEGELWGTREQPSIGILTGNSPESGMHLWNELNRRVREILGSLSCGDVSMPPATVFSLPALGLTMELDRREEEIWPHLCKAVVDACRSGVQVLAIACHTTHYFTPKVRKICDEYGTEFLSMAEVLATWLRHEGIQEIALVGIRHVSELGPWSAYREPLQGIRVEQPTERAKQLLDELAYQVKAEGPSEAGLNRLRDILRREVASDTVVLALTELSILLSLQRKKGRSGRLLIDPLALYAEALAAKYLGLTFPRE
ncbi:MAG TPA: aspartate/glutamate racemase family protein [Thermoanaerobaculia bacterium]